MKATLPIMVLIATVTAPASAGTPPVFRLFLAPEGVKDNAPLNGLSPTLANPVVDASGGPQKLYVWGQVLGDEPVQKYIAVSYNVITTGTASVVAARTWNYTNILARWAIINGGTLGLGSLSDVRLAAHPTSNFGVANNDFNGFDDQYDPATDATLLGWIEVEGTGDIFLQLGEIGVIRTGSGWGKVILGFGDEDDPVVANEFNQGSPIAEARVFTVAPCDPCDTTCNGTADAFDIEPFLGLLYSGDSPCSACAGDVDDSGVIDAFDISPFFACLFGEEPPTGPQDTFRIFFDTSGNAGANNAPHPGNATLSLGNPELPPGGGRLYIYGEFQNVGQTGTGQVIVSPNFDVEIDGGTITGAWNYNGPGQDSFQNDQRWDWAAPNPVVNPGATIVSFTAASMTHLGLGNGALHDIFDVQHDESTGFGTTLLGYVDVQAPDEASVWITVGVQGFAIQGGTGPDDRIFLGFGDASVPAGGVFGQSTIPEATIATSRQPNDNCADAIDIFDGDTPFVNGNAGSDGPPLPPECDDGSGVDFVGDVWFSYTSPCSGTLTVSTCDQATFNTSLAAYVGDCDGLALIACNDDGDGCSGGTSQMDVPVTCGQAVLLRVGWFFGFLGDGTLTLTCNEGACPIGSADLDGNGTVDLRDHALFQLQFDGP